MAYQGRPAEPSASSTPLEFPYIGLLFLFVYFFINEKTIVHIGDVGQYEKIDKIGQGTFG